MELLLIRHAATFGNTLSRYIGVTDEPLCQEGISTAETKRGIYPDAETVYVSPLLRCRQTAGIIFPNLTQCVIEKLRETDFGRFENKSYEDLKNDPDYIKWLDSNGEACFPGGESRETASKRVLIGFGELLDDARKRNINKAAVVVHGGTIMAVMSEYALPKRGFYDWQVRNCSGYVVRLEKGNRQISQPISTENGYPSSMPGALLLELCSIC